MAGLELQGLKVRFTEAMFNHYGEVNLENGRRSTWVQENNIYYWAAQYLRALVQVSAEG